MVDINNWVLEMLGKTRHVFGDRLLFLGLQGSYQRGEATQGSDIDIVVVLDELDMTSLREYKKIIADMPHSEKACGFVGGKSELVNWPKHELFQFAKDTKAYHGELDALLPEITKEDIIDSVKIGASMLYHSACHTFLHGKEEGHADALSCFYKDVFFILRAVYYLRNGQYIATKKDMLSLLDSAEKELLSVSMDLKNCKEYFSGRPDKYYENIINWSSGILQERF